jgi:hypothetical protein
MKKYTVKDAKACFERVVALKGKRIAKRFDDVSGWSLDCNATYGGCAINQIASKSGGMHTVTNRLPPKQFCEAVWFAEGIERKYQDHLDAAKRRKAKKSRGR